MAEEVRSKEQEIAELKAELGVRTRQVGELLAVMAPPEVKELTKEEKALVAEGCKAWGIAEQYVLKARVEEGQKGEKVAVIITHGGAKVRFPKGMDPKTVVPLEAIRVDGIIRKKMKPVTGKKS